MESRTGKRNTKRTTEQRKKKIRASRKHQSILEAGHSATDSHINEEKCPSFTTHAPDQSPVIVSLVYTKRLPPPPPLQPPPPSPLPLRHGSFVA
ncbi:hypothetical protein E2C01_046937 [Portunus trituberculatus]|uniref:Uncharacterized protein n=1 Tax=Portunus trituberculatus TaxID=210409 RepID=A0A5B7G722_PORTR|nr:hypothetical protein [Portunus trituberculatus]